MRNSHEFCMSLRVVVPVESEPGPATGIDVAAPGATARSAADGHAGHDHAWFFEHDERDPALHHADADDGTVFRREKEGNHRAVTNGTANRSSSRAWKIFCGCSVLHNPVIHAVDTDRHPVSL